MRLWSKVTRFLLFTATVASDFFLDFAVPGPIVLTQVSRSSGSRESSPFFGNKWQMVRYVIADASEQLFQGQ